MKKLLDNLYIFSKFSVVLILLFSLLGVLYIVYINYNKEELVTRKTSNLEIELKKSINNNSKLINNIVSEIEINKSTLSKINKNLKSLSEQNNYETILKFNKNINLLNKNIEVISSEIENLKKTYNKSQSENNYNKINIIEENKKNIIELILIKYENNKNFEKELEFLKKNSNTNLISNFEKISILMAEPYKGHNNLKSIFDDEVNIYLKEIIYKNKDSLFNKIILPYVDVSPTSENSINDDKIFKLKKIEQYLEKKQLEKVIQNIETISNYNKFFTLTLIEIRKYLRFKEELYNLI